LKERRQHPEDDARRHDTHQGVSGAKTFRERLGDTVKRVAAFAGHAVAAGQVGDAAKAVTESERQQCAAGGQGIVADPK
jgi:hypothetical protein